MEIIADTTLTKCFKILDKLEVGQMILVKDYAPNNPTLFIDCCKQFYDCHRNIRFSDDYSTIKQIERDLTFNEINEQYKNYFA
jgi:hypothetical protein